MKKIIFWYGSLLWAEWWNKTLNRKIYSNDLKYIEVKWFKRVWNYTNPIIFLDEPKKIYWWVFLDIIEDSKSILNWYGLEVSDYEFELIKQREKWYKMLNITKNIINPLKWYEYFTSYLINKNNNNWLNNIIARKYVDFVEAIVNNYSKDFILKYRKSTSVIKFHIKDWDYKFVDNNINKATWRIC